MTLADWASVAMAFGLLIITGGYTYYTYGQIKPYIKCSIDYQNSDTLLFIIQNTGKGAAHDVQAKWRVRGPNCECREWKISLCSPGERHRFAIPLGSKDKRLTKIGAISEELGNRKGVIEFTASCENILGRNHFFRQTVSISKNLDRIDDAQELPSQPPLEKLNGHLQRIEQNFEEFTTQENSQTHVQKEES